MPQPHDLQKMLAQAQEMMAAQEEAQAKLREQTVEASAGGGMVKVALSGDGQMTSLTIAPDVVDPDDVEMLQDLVLAAVNEGLRQVAQLAQQALGGRDEQDFDPMSALEQLGLGGPGGAGPRPPQMNRAQRRAAQRKGR